VEAGSRDWPNSARIRFSNSRMRPFSAPAMNELSQLRVSPSEPSAVIRRDASVISQIWQAAGAARVKWVTAWPGK
jgi:hypothetical protein